MTTIIYKFQSFEDLERGIYGVSLDTPDVPRELYSSAEYVLPDGVEVGEDMCGRTRLYKYGVPCGLEATKAGIIFHGPGGHEPLKKLRDIDPALTDWVIPR